MPRNLRLMTFVTLFATGSSTARTPLAAETAAESKPAPRSLEARISPLIKAHEGEVAVVVRSLRGNERYEYRADVPMPTASLIKMAVMVEAYRQSEAGKLDLKRTLTLKKEDKAPGSGILAYHFSDGATFPLLDAVHLMIAFSDNTAANLVVDAVGLPSTAATMASLGYPNTKLHSKVFHRETSIFPDRSKDFGLGSTTADEAARLATAIWEKTILSTASCDAMIAHLRACEDNDKFPRFLPRGKVAHKTGSVDDVRTDVGVVDCPRGAVALAVLTRCNKDRRYAPDNAGNVLCARIAEQVYDYFSQP